MKRRSFLKSLAAALIAGEVAQRLLLTRPEPSVDVESLAATVSSDWVYGFCPYEVAWISSDQLVTNAIGEIRPYKGGVRFHIRQYPVSTSDDFIVFANA